MVGMQSKFTRHLAAFEDDTRQKNVMTAWSLMLSTISKWTELKKCDICIGKMSVIIC